VAQPDVGRVGGLTEAMRVCALARERSVTVVPHAWKTGIFKTRRNRIVKKALTPIPDSSIRESVPRALMSRWPRRLVSGPGALISQRNRKKKLTRSEARSGRSSRQVLVVLSFPRC
jgi:Enolase C-terminal domain-like